MLRTSQISIANILALALVVAALAVGNGLVTIIVCEAIAVFAFVKILTGNLPSAIQESSRANCRRLDGSWSTRREAIERKAHRKLFNTVVLLLLFIVVPSNVLFLFVNEEVFPLSVGFDAISNFRASPEEWKANLRDEESSFERWGRARHLSRESIDTRKRAIWHSWPMLVLGGIAWVVFCIFFFNGTYDRALRDLADSTQVRAEEYLVHDFTKSSSNAAVETMPISRATSRGVGVRTR